MNLDKLFQAQKVLRDRINYTGEDRFEKLILALLVEIGECANEWRGFKYWSKNQEPRAMQRVGCEDCAGTGNIYWDSNYVDTEQKYQLCETCMGIGKIRKNPLLEEYVDGLHFILDIGIGLGFEEKERAVIWRLPNADTLEEFTAVFRSVVMLDTYRGIMEYQRLLSVYYRLGMSLGFTVQQIEQAYFDKNAVNHQRQENGY